MRGLWQYVSKFKICITLDSGISLLGTDAYEIVVFSRMFFEVLAIMVTYWKQRKYPWKGDWLSG